MVSGEDQLFATRDPPVRTITLKKVIRGSSVTQWRDWVWVKKPDFVKKCTNSPLRNVTGELD